jgi:glycyl-tRNA synthetase
VEVFFNPKNADDPRYDGDLGRSLAFRLPDGSDDRLTVQEGLQKGILPNKLAGHYLVLIVEFYEAAGIKAENIRLRVLSEEDRAFYSTAAFDLEVKLSWGWVELVACNYRGSYDLGGHARVSGSTFTVLDGDEKVLPHVFELSLGIDRSIFAIIESSMTGEGDRRVMALKPYLSPTQVCVFPLVNKDGLPEKAMGLYADLRESFEAFYDDSGAIGRRYARADEGAVPACVTLDYDTLKDGTVTLRDRDTRQQQRVSVAELKSQLTDVTAYPPIGKKA